MLSKLTDKQKLFCDEFLKDLNATQAAIRAGYSPKTAQTIGAENLRKPLIQEYLKKRMDARSVRTEITQDMVLKEWGCIAFANLLDFIKFNSRGIVEMKGSDELTPEQGRILAEVSQISGNTTAFKFKLHDKMKALDSIAKHLGMFMDKGLNLEDNIIPPGHIDSVEREAQRRIAAIKGQVH